MNAVLRESLAGDRRQVHLCGFMGSGKSTVGRLVARRLLWNFLDLDGMVERHEGSPVARIFEDSGEEHFRRCERHVLRQVVSKPATVVALGGGTLIDTANQDLCRQAAAVVWLRCPLEVIEARLQGAPEGRPLWAEGQALESRFEERLPGYESAEFCVDADAGPEKVAACIIAVLGVSEGDQ